MTVGVLEQARARTHAAWLIPALVAAVAAAVTWWASVPYIVGVFHDDGVYALLARSLASGQGFHYLQLPGAPAATHYPPLYPLALAAVWRLNPSFPDNIPAMLALNALCIGVAALGIQWLLRQWFTWRRESAGLVTLCALLCVPTLTLTGALMSEPLFLACLPPVLLLVQRALDRDDHRSTVLAGLATGVLMLVRTHGLALLGAALLLLLSRRDWRRAASLFAAAVIVQLPWLAWCATASNLVPGPLQGTYGAYQIFFREGWRAGGLPLLVATVGANLKELWLLLGDRVWGGLGSVLGVSAIVLLVALLAAGAWRTWRRSPLLVVFLALYFGIIVVMSFAPYRYAWGVWPLLVVLAVLGAEWLVDASGSGWRRAATCLVVALPLAAIARTEVLGYRTSAWEAPTRAASRSIAPGVEWIRRSTPPDARVLFESPEILMLFTGRQGAPPEPFTAMEYIHPMTDADHARGLDAMLASVPADYLVTMSPALQRAAVSSPLLRPLGSLGSTAMFEVRR